MAKARGNKVKAGCALVTAVMIGQWVPQHFASPKRSPNVVFMLGQRLSRWSNIKVTLFPCLVFTGPVSEVCLECHECISNHKSRIT